MRVGSALSLGGECPRFVGGLKLSAAFELRRIWYDPESPVVCGHTK